MDFAAERMLCRHRSATARRGAPGCRWMELRPRAARAPGAPTIRQLCVSRCPSPRTMCGETTRRDRPGSDRSAVQWPGCSWHSLAGCARPHSAAHPRGRSSAGSWLPHSPSWGAAAPPRPPPPLQMSEATGTHRARTASTTVGRGLTVRGAPQRRRVCLAWPARLRVSRPQRCEAARDAERRASAGQQAGGQL